MRTRYIRDRPDRRDDLVAGAVAGALAAGVGAVTFYLVRLLLAREPVPERPGRHPEGTERQAAPGGARGTDPEEG